MSKFKYQSQVDTIIEWYNQGKSYAEIARLLQSDDIRKDSQNVRRLLINKLGDIHGHPKIIITDEIKIQIQQLLAKGESPKKISTILNIKYPTIEGYLRLQGYKFLPNPGNIHYFETIDTYAKAYILGFIAADGALVPAKKGPTITLTITIKYEDKAILEFIKSEIGNSHKLQDIKRPSGFDSSKMIHHVRLTMSNPQIVRDIMKYGITFNKSLTMGNIIENIPIGFRDAFIIGYFDGDGSVHIETKPRKNSRNVLCNDNSLYINIRGTRPFLEGICNHLNIDTSHIYQHDSIPNLAFANKKDTYRFYQCYQYLPFYYKRKHDRFLAKINHPSYDKYKQGQTISSPTT
jgi:hypothetical protein